MSSFLTLRVLLLEHVPHPELCLAREAAAAAQVGQHQERRRDPLIAGRILEIRPVGQVEHVEEDLDRLPSWHAASPAGPQVDLEVIRAEGAVLAALVLHPCHDL